MQRRLRNTVSNTTVISQKLFFITPNLHIFFNISLIGMHYSIAQLVKNPPAMQETPVQFLGWEDPLEKG